MECVRQLQLILGSNWREWADVARSLSAKPTKLKAAVDYLWGEGGDSAPVIFEHLNPLDEELIAFAIV